MFHSSIGFGDMYTIYIFSRIIDKKDKNTNYCLSDTENVKQFLDLYTAKLNINISNIMLLE